MFKKILIILSLFIHVDASDNSQDISIAKRLTKELLVSLKEKQQAIVASEAKLDEIGTFATFNMDTRQKLIYNNLKYQKIFFVDFYQKYLDHINSFIVVAATEDNVRLSYQDESAVYRALDNDSNTDQIDNYKIIGEKPSIFLVDGKIERDPMFNITTGQILVVDMICEYIKHNKKEVFEKCLGKGLPEIKSRDIWRPCSCDLQLHKSCFKQCQYNNITSCINPFCMQGKKEANALLKVVWDKSFYDFVIDKAPKLPLEEIREIDCPVCFESLKPKKLGQNLPIKKRRRIDKN